jgi:hypothetical protein
VNVSYCEGSQKGTTSNKPSRVPAKAVVVTKPDESAGRGLNWTVGGLTAAGLFYLAMLETLSGLRSGCD